MSLSPYWADDQVTLHLGDCLEVLAEMEAGSVDAIVTDPPYGLEFMGKEWDSFRQSGSEWSQKRATGTDWKGTKRERPGRLYMRSHHDTCTLCRKQKHQHDDVACPAPDYQRVTHEPIQMRAYQEWCEQWATECLRVLKPGGHLLAFGGTRTWHRLSCGIEDAGFEIRESVADLTGIDGPGLLWLHGQGFPKNRDVSKAIDKATGAERDVTEWRTDGLRSPGFEAKDRGRVKPAGQRSAVFPVTAPATEDAARWEGWGTALKPAWEPVVVARKPLAGTVAANVLEHGTGAFNIAGCLVEPTGESRPRVGEASQETRYADSGGTDFAALPGVRGGGPARRWPPNVVLGAEAAAELDRQSGVRVSGDAPARRGSAVFKDCYGEFAGQSECPPGRSANSGGASRFFPVFRYEAKAGSAERPRGEDGTAHPTVKPIDLMAWLVRLVTPPGGLVLDPFAGSGTTAEACIIEGFRCVLVEKDPAYAELIRTRLRKDIQPVMFGEEIA